VVPGGPPHIISSLVESEWEEFLFVRDFGFQAPRDGKTPRTILSICTGALFLGASGLLDGIKATTHHLFLDELRTLCETKGKTEVIHAKYVDGGVRENNIQIITGGGVSSGLDSACYFVSRTLSPEMASFAEK
jgi:transcriptional regulator GlxA family with amidase domain